MRGFFESKDGVYYNASARLGVLLSDSDFRPMSLEIDGVIDLDLLAVLGNEHGVAVGVARNDDLRVLSKINLEAASAYATLISSSASLPPWLIDVC